MPEFPDVLICQYRTLAALGADRRIISRSRHAAAFSTRFLDGFIYTLVPTGALKLPYLLVSCISDHRCVFDSPLKIPVRITTTWAMVVVRELLHVLRIILSIALGAVRARVRVIHEVIRILSIATGAVLARRPAAKLLLAVVDRATKVRYGLAHISSFIVLRRAPQVRLLPVHFF